MIEFQKFNAECLWQVKVGEASPARKMNLNLIPKSGPISGFGIYAISYNDPIEGDRIVYLGKFAGEKKKGKVDDALGGDIRQRWFKHIGTATLLLSNLKMASSKYYFDQKTRALEFYKNDEEFLEAFKGSFLDLDDNTTNALVFKRGADLQVSKNRLGFAIQNLKKTNLKNPNGLSDLGEIISSFTCHYWQWTSSKKMTKTIIDPDLKGGKGRQGVESEIIEKYAQRLPMNREYMPSSSVLDRFYHYTPNSLIEVGGKDYKEFSEFIGGKLHNKFRSH